METTYQTIFERCLTMKLSFKKAYFITFGDYPCDNYLRVLIDSGFDIEIIERIVKQGY